MRRLDRLDRGAHAACRFSVVVLDHCFLGEIHAVRHAPGNDDGLFFVHPEAGRGFARPRHHGAAACLAERLDQRPGGAGNATHATHDVQGQALAGKNGPGGPSHRQDRGTGIDPLAILDVDVAGGTEPGKHLDGDGAASQEGAFTDAKHRLALHVGAENGVGGHVFGRAVFFEVGTQPVHEAGDRFGHENVPSVARTAQNHLVREIKSPLMRALRWLLIPLLLAAPAQALDIELDVWGSPLLPDEVVVLEGFVVAQCDELLHPVAGDLAGGGMRTAHLSFEAPEGIQITAPSAVHFDRTACLPADDATLIPVQVEVTATDILPALEVQTVTYTAAWSDGSVVAERNMVVQMEYLPGFDVSVADAEKKGAPQKQVPYDVTVCNHANGRSQFDFEVLTRDLAGAALAPDRLILDAAGSGRECITIIVTYVTPFENGSNDHQENFTVQVAQAFLHDPARLGPTHTVEFGAETEGVYVPGPGLLLGPALLALAGLRRR